MNTNIGYLFITLILLTLVIVVHQQYNNNKEERLLKRGESFVGRVPNVPMGNEYMPIYSVPGTQPYGQPMMYQEQMYPKIPYYADTMENIGRPCKNPNGCGVFGSCSNGICTIKDQNKTVFDIKI